MKKRSSALVVTVVAVLAAMHALQAAPAPARISITRLDAAPELAALPLAPWVKPGDTSWYKGAPAFEPRGEADTATARGWVAVTDEAVLVRIIVQDDKHTGSGGQNSWKGDSVQLGVIPLPAGEKPADPESKSMGPTGMSLCFSLTGGGPSTWVYKLSGSRKPGARPDLPAKIVRDEEKETTTYDMRIPWSEFKLKAGCSPLVGLSVQVNDTDQGKKKQQKMLWGTGIGGRFRPGQFKWMRVGTPAQSFAAAMVTNRMLCEERPAARAVLAFTPATDCTITASFGGAKASLNAKAGAFTRFEVTGVTEPNLIGTAAFAVSVADSNGKVLAEASAKVRGDFEAYWYAFNPVNDSGPSVIGMEDWLEGPAGKHGGVRMVDDHFEFEDGTRVKFWGVNHSYGGCAPPKEEADRRAAHFRKYGVNCIRLHKFTNPGRQGIGSGETVTKMDPAGLERLDYYHAQLKKNGIYTGWSSIFGLKLCPGDRDKVPAFDEIMKVTKDKRGRVRIKGSTIGYKFINRAVQDLHIQQTVNLLNHVNPHTGLKYAEDPVLAYVEFHNEDDIFWYTMATVIEKSPLHRKMFCEQFSDWLKKKYGSHAGLVKAWGKQSIDAFPQWMKGEHLDKRNIYPVANPWFTSQFALDGQMKPHKKRLLDTSRFMYDQQLDFYQRFGKAIRATGFKGSLVGSCWRAGSGVPHYYNLHTDYMVGHIDRHDYFGDGGGGHSSFSALSMLAEPGSGLLAEGFSQVKDRPFALSEWINVNPHEWAAEGTAIIGIYAMGLQGWDASYQFNASAAGFTDTIGRRWNTQQPSALGIYPAISRLVLRGDVAEGDVVSARKVHVPSLAEGKLDFGESVVEGAMHDFKTFTSDVPNRALAVGRVVVEFTKKYDATEKTDITEYVNGNVTKSTTGELTWITNPDATVYGDQQGYFTVNTAGTKAIVGFAPKKPYTLGDVTITPDNLFAVIFVTSLDKEKDITDTKRVLITALARTKNTGMKRNAAHTRLLSQGNAPVLMEPVRAIINMKRVGKAVVNVLDHDGRRTGKTVTFKNGQFTIDGIRDKTMYYEIVYK